jgi:hypothetical protein
MRHQCVTDASPMRQHFGHALHKAAPGGASVLAGATVLNQILFSLRVTRLAPMMGGRGGGSSPPPVFSNCRLTKAERCIFSSDRKTYFLTKHVCVSSWSLFVLCLINFLLKTQTMLIVIFDIRSYQGLKLFRVFNSRLCFYFADHAIQVLWRCLVTAVALWFVF